MLIVTVAIVAAAISFASGALVRKIMVESKANAAKQDAHKLLEQTKKEAESKKKEILIEAKDQAYSLRSEAEKDQRQRRQEISKLEKRLSQREDDVSAKLSKLSAKEKEASQYQERVKKKESELNVLFEEQKTKLEQVASLSVQEAKDILMNKVEDEARRDVAIMIRDIEAEAKEEADKKARNIITLAIQRCAADQVAETTVSVVPIPSEDIKGRIIGREGRNIRTFENLSGINLIIDDTPEAVILSGFDPVRREIARITLEKLITDGRIQPARIEEMYNKTKKEVEVEIKKAGERAAIDTDIRGIHPELLRVLGRLKYRTSYGQNVLQHSVEVAALASTMANELGIDGQMAKRAGLLHDLGKAIDHEVEGPHAEIGADLAKRFKENSLVLNAIAAHHEAVEPESIEAILVKASDAISGARPGARRENLESYIKRLENLEQLAESHKGVAKCFAVQAGREIRVMVNPEEVNDAESALLAREISKKIEEELEYPGQIKVIIIRESRNIEYAK
ncbi:hypothetical protein LCGC14_1078090 [marine sediment metagenome]|uniref:HD domain-containing protein n=1 Tax=marine sediment metagenome TaxID=412755 RepID=A0A0F9N3N2_9ZZZZ|nr:ribonuclease Y [Actinomycetota bacterium]